MGCVKNGLLNTEQLHKWCVALLYVCRWHLKIEKQAFWEVMMIVKHLF